MSDETDDLCLAVAKALHASDRSGSWDKCAHKSGWLRWARAAVKAVRKHDARLQGQK